MNVSKLQNQVQKQSTIFRPSFFLKHLIPLRKSRHPTKIFIDCQASTSGIHQVLWVSMKKFKLKPFCIKLIRCIISWEFLYLALFGVGQILNIVWGNSNLIIANYLPISLLIASFIIKMVLLFVKNKITFKHFMRMQLDFVSPYVLMVVNIVLLAESFLAIESFSLYRELIANPTLSIVINCLQLVFGVVICSLVMNKKCTTKFEFYAILVIIILQAGSNLYQTVTDISSINEVIDEIGDQQNYFLIQFMTGKIGLDDYNADYAFLSQFQSATQTAKDFNLACIASIISLLLIQIDLIARPLQKMEHQQEIYEDLLQNRHLYRKTYMRQTLSNSAAVQITKSLIEDTKKAKEIEIVDMIEKQRDKSHSVN